MNEVHCYGGRGTARSSNQAPNNATQTKQTAHKQE